VNILITGGAGFIGSHVVDASIGEGHNVTVIDDLSTGRLDNLNRKAKFIKIDIRDEAINNLFAGGDFDAVIHHAAQMDVRRSVEDPRHDASVNIIGSLNLLENCIVNGIKKFIFASTGGAIYGEQEYFPADESHPVNPLSPYGIAKLAVEKYIFYYHVVHGLQYVNLRYANVYGPRQNPHGEAGVVAIFSSKLLNGKETLINGDGRQTRDYTYVSDVVRANMLALAFGDSGTFNVGTGSETDVNQLFRMIRELVGSSCQEKHGQAKRGEQIRSVLDHSRIRKILEWEPTVNIREGLEKTVDFFRNRKTNDR
jgi:UDP-glucose 4-epimerase